MESRISSPAKTGSSNQTAYGRAIGALGRALQSVRPDLPLSRSDSVSCWKDNLVPGIEPSWFQAELEEGDGGELKGKFRAAHSSSALAVNTFARFKPTPELLSLAGWSGFECFQFEAKCTAGIVGRRSPNLDLLLTLPSEVIGVESKCTEHLTKHTAKFAAAYDEQITDRRRETAWFRLMHKLIEEPRRYRYLDAAQLVKHAFGLGHCFASLNVALLYLYWEPRNAGDFPEFREHRNEVARFVSEVAGTKPSFKAMSYRDLWATWSELQSPDWLPAHLAALKSRYDIEI